MPKNMALDGMHLCDSAYTQWNEAIEEYLVFKK